jgi:hypothetical protein
MRPIFAIAGAYALLIGLWYASEWLSVLIGCRWWVVYGVSLAIAALFVVGVTCVLAGAESDRRPIYGGKK